jgi:hypothetical protein
MPSPTSPTKIVAPDNMDPVEESIHLGAIVRIFGKVYTMSKMMEAIAFYYGTEVGLAPMLLPISCFLEV